LTSRRTTSLALSCVGVIAAVIGVTTWLVNRSSGPAVNHAQARAMLPVIDAYLDKAIAQQGFGYLSPQLKPREFCNTTIIEIRPDGPRWSVGMAANCGEFARRGATLVEGTSGYPGIGEVIILSGHAGRYRVLSLQVGPPSADHAWVDSHFSPAAAAEVLSANPPTAPDPISQAWRAFGFPPGTRATTA
jgi:hypothetical protein